MNTNTQILQSALPDMPDKIQGEEYNYKVCQYTTLSQAPDNNSTPSDAGIISIFDGNIYFSGYFLLESTEGTNGTEGTAEEELLWAKYPVVRVSSSND